MKPEWQAEEWREELANALFKNEPVPESVPLSGKLGLAVGKVVLIPIIGIGWLLDRTRPTNRFKHGFILGIGSVAMSRMMGEIKTKINDMVGKVADAADTIVETTLGPGKRLNQDTL